MKFSNESYYEQLKGLLRRVKPHGHYFSALCPFHDDHEPSLLVYPDGFKCMGCNRSGSLPQLMKAALRKGRKISAKNLAELTPITSHLNKPNNITQEELAWLAHDTLSAFPDLLAGYLKRRKVFGQIDTAHIGWWDGYFTFPALDEDDKFLACPMRADSVNEAITGNRWLPCTSTLYVPNWPLFLRSQKIIIVYGIFDALSLSELGIAVCSSTLGKNFDPCWLDKYRSKKFLALPDRGEEQEARKLIAGLGWRGMRVIDYDWPEGCKDANDLVVHGYSDCLMAQVS